MPNRPTHKSSINRQASRLPTAISASRETRETSNVSNADLRPGESGRLNGDTDYRTSDRRVTGAVTFVGRRNPVLALEEGRVRARFA